MATAKSKLAKAQLWRDSFNTTVLIKNLTLQALDQREMSDKAIAASKILLAKTVPDLKQIDMDVAGSVDHVVRLKW